jgi:hypothetical protein
MSECLGDFTKVTMKAGAIYGTISNAKSKRIDHIQFAKENKKGYMKDIAIIYKEYERQLANLNLVVHTNHEDTFIYPVYLQVESRTLIIY